MHLRFNNKSVEIIKLSTLLESFESLIKITENEVSTFCSYFLEIGATDVWADLNYFKYFAKQMAEENLLKYPLTYVYQASIGFENLKKKLAEFLISIPVSTVTAERSFNATNRIMNKIRNRMGSETLQYWVKIYIEGPNKLK